ncbi:MAG: ATP-binding protein [Planctomycetaceae bacterium]
MAFAFLDKTLTRIAELIQEQRFEELEIHDLEIKLVPPRGADWKTLYQSISAFLNTSGGIVLLGIKEEGTGPKRRYVFQGWNPHAEGKLRQLPNLFTDSEGKPLDLTTAFPPPEIRPFLEGQVAMQPVVELPEELKYAFLEGRAYKRVATSDVLVNAGDIARQERRRQEAQHAQELEPVAGTTLGNFHLDTLNEFIRQLNQVVPTETWKPDLAAAVSFLERQRFLVNGTATILGLLVCGQHPSDHLGLRCQVHGFVDVPHEIARDKQILIDNILPLMENTWRYVLRNIHVGVSLEHGGTPLPQYPDALLRETINNALAHRDYSINKQVLVTIRPGESLSIENPGTFPRDMRIESSRSEVPVLCLLPEAHPRNPKLADILSRYRKWEGLGIGMATLVDLCLRNEIDLPTYQLRQQDVTLILRSGKLVDDPIERLFESFDRFLRDRLEGAALNASQKAVLAYLIKAERAHQQRRYSILLSHNNNHSQELHRLKKAGLIEEHESSLPEYPVYVPCRTLMRTDFYRELRGQFGLLFDAATELQQQILNVVYRYGQFSLRTAVSAKLASLDLWSSQGRPQDIRMFDDYYRKVRTAFNKLEKTGLIRKVEGSRGGYVLNPDGGKGILKPLTAD